MRTIKIGTRSSQLAMWQATTVANQLEHLGHSTEIVKIDSIGDVVLDKPLYELGITGVFTKNLDIALLNGKIDIAVHSLKDVPTILPKGIVEAAILKRGNSNDVLVLKNNENFFDKDNVTIATGSLRRKAQWLHRYPNHNITGLRGNVNTRLRKLEENDWQGAIFAAAGLKRLHLLPKDHLNLDWMIPAPAQGAVMVAALEKDLEILEICKEINDEDTATCVHVERKFLNVLEGGCTAPIGALAYFNKDEFNFKGVLFSPDGKHKLEYSKAVPKDKIENLAETAANYILDRGGKKLMRPEISIEKDFTVVSTKVLSQKQLELFNNTIDVETSEFITVRDNRLKPSALNSVSKNVIITSQNAVESLLNNFSKEELNFENIYCVGRRTKKRIESRIGKVTKMQSSGEKLANYLVENVSDKEVTYFCGDQRRDELPTILTKNNFKLNEIVCYQTQLSPKKIDKKHQGVLFFSPTGVESYIKQNKANTSVAFCIGNTTANAAKKYFQQTIVASVPTVESVVKNVNNHFQTKN
ncbi:MAG TPA: hydroxymethylbilane synthase [Flavobacteriaceae bacterium]|nr:hydroxymethylbilane synthase [Flavobacteriaceae bacterium]